MCGCAYCAPCANMKKKRIFAALALVIMLLPLTGCAGMLAGEGAQPQETMPPMTAEMFTDLASVSKRYNETDFDDTMETLTARYGEPQEVQDENGSFWNFLDENGEGLSAIFFADGGRCAPK